MGEFDSPSGDDLMKQEPNEVEVGYFKKRQDEFNKEVIKGIGKNAKVITPKKTKKSKKD